MRRRGFTLIEMMIVVGIVGIMVAIAIPVMSGINKRTRGRDAIRELQAKVTQARGLATSGQTNPAWPAPARTVNAGIRFDSATSYVVYIDRDTTLNGNEVVMSVVNMEQPNGAAPVQISNPSTFPADMRMKSNGSLVSGVAATFVVQDAEQRTTQTLRVSLSGMPKIL
jgi:prepilin-type N-terminal cleavage/methylation domain-containing protein